MKPDGRLTRRESFAALAGATAGLRGLGAQSPVKRLVAEAGKHGWAGKGIGFRVAGVGRGLLGVPYVGGSLDRDPSRETCLAVWDALDCVTFVESSLALARALRSGRDIEAAVVKELEWIRYRGGRLDGYASRLHYTSDWLLDNAARGTLQILGSDWPFAQEWSKGIDFMSKHAARYPVLKARPELVGPIRAAETALSGKKLPFVPRAAAARLEEELREGDLVAFCTTEAGLDCSHVGMIVVEQARPRLLHASSAKGKVVVDAPLADILASGRASGVFVARPLEPR